MFVFMVMLKIIRKTSAGTNRSTKNLACYVFLKQIKTRINFELMIYLRCDAKLSVTLLWSIFNCSNTSAPQRFSLVFFPLVVFSARKVGNDRKYSENSLYFIKNTSCFKFTG